MGFAQGISGLNSSAANLDVIGNNIANSSTIGFKSGSAQFADIYAGSRVGLGTQVSGVLQNFTSGAVQTSSRALDVAIVNGDGFFRLAGTSGEITYSRNGQFNTDKDGYLVNAEGSRLTGYPVGANGAIGVVPPVALQVPTTGISPKATTSVTAQLNIDSRADIPLNTPFSAKDSSTYNYSNAVTVYDSLGNSHELATFFAKTGANTWDVYATADGQALTSTGAVAVPPATAAGPVDSLTFDGNGLLTSGGTVNFAGLAWTSGADASNFTMNLTGTTQFGNSNDVKKLTQDGYTSGQMTSFSIGQDGIITGKYSNEQTTPLGRIVLSEFVNPNGLQPKGGNAWGETAASGQALTGTPGTGTKIGSLASGSVEESNVDLTSELVNLIVAQRAYQANAQTVKTQDQVMQTLVNMR